jgi:hypothetical protein
MSRLVVVQLEVCQGLQKVELVGLPALQQLHITACGQVREVAGLGQLAALTQLKVERCSQLLTQEALPTTLQHLTINSCGELTVPGLEGLVPLTELRLNDYHQLQEVRGFTALQQLAIWDCYQLKKVDVRGCTALKSVPPGMLGTEGAERRGAAGCGGRAPPCGGWGGAAARSGP